MNIEKSVVENMDRITLSNGIIEVQVLDVGASLYSFKSLKDGINCVINHKDLNKYYDNTTYLGASIGPLGGRTSQGVYGLNLSQNDGINHLHGHTQGLHHQRFDYKANEDFVVFTKRVDHSVDGYNGSVKYEITYKLDGNSLVLEMKAWPDNPMPLNLTNHSYFNLSGEDTIHNHEFQLSGDAISFVSETMENYGNLVDVKGTLFDFNEFTSLGEFLPKHHEQYAITKHLDHGFMGSKCVIRSYRKSLEMSTSLPSIQVYLANFFEREGVVDGLGRVAKDHAALTIEPQYLPNDPDLEIFTSECPYHSVTRYTLNL